MVSGAPALSTPLWRRRRAAQALLPSHTHTQRPAKRPAPSVRPSARHESWDRSEVNSAAVGAACEGDFHHPRHSSCFAFGAWDQCSHLHLLSFHAMNGDRDPSTRGGDVTEATFREADIFSEFSEKGKTLDNRVG